MPRPKTAVRFSCHAHSKILREVPHPNAIIFSSNLEKSENYSWREVGRGDKSPLYPRGAAPASWRLDMSSPVPCLLSPVPCLEYLRVTNVLPYVLPSELQASDQNLTCYHVLPSFFKKNIAAIFFLKNDGNTW